MTSHQSKPTAGVSRTTAPLKYHARHTQMHRMGLTVTPAIVLIVMSVSVRGGNLPIKQGRVNTMYRNPKLLKAVASLPCQECGKEGTQAAHANWSWSGKGMGMKAHDMYVAALCPECHYILDQGKDLAKWEREEMWLRAWRKTIYELFERGLVDVRSKT